MLIFKYIKLLITFYFQIEVYYYDFKIIGLNFKKFFESFDQLFFINHRNNLFCD